VQLEHSPTESVSLDGEESDRVTRESDRVNAVLQALRTMKMNPNDPVPGYPARQAFWRWVRRWATITLSVPLSLWAVEYLLSDLSTLEVIALPAIWVAINVLIAAVIGLLILFITACHGERIEDYGYRVRVFHDQANADRLRQFTVESIKQAAVHIKRVLEQRVELRNMAVIFMLGTEAILRIWLDSSGFSKTSQLYIQFLGYCALSAPILLFVQVHSFLSLPKLRYQLSIAELAQHLERKQSLPLLTTPKIKQPKSLARGLLWITLGIVGRRIRNRD
jgi:hypothetical protein